MDAQPCDPLVLFGVTGDLAGKMILPAIDKLTAGGSLEVPVIGVARHDRAAHPGIRPWGGPAGLWGPPEAERVLPAAERWHNPAPK